MIIREGKIEIIKLMRAVLYHYDRDVISFESCKSLIKIYFETLSGLEEMRNEIVKIIENDN